MALFCVSFLALFQGKCGALQLRKPGISWTFVHICSHLSGFTSRSCTHYLDSPRSWMVICPEPSDHPGMTFSAFVWPCWWWWWQGMHCGHCLSNSAGIRGHNNKASQGITEGGRRHNAPRQTVTPCDGKGRGFNSMEFYSAEKCTLPLWYHKSL